MQAARTQAIEVAKAKEEEDAIYDRAEKAKDEVWRLRDELGDKYNLDNIFILNF